MMKPGGFAKPVRKAAAAEEPTPNAQQGMTEEQMEAAWKSIQNELIDAKQVLAMRGSLPAGQDQEGFHGLTSLAVLGELAQVRQ